jgi:pimeloyl-ACP methyl ester carboxylesterase
MEYGLRRTHETDRKLKEIDMSGAGDWPLQTRTDVVVSADGTGIAYRIVGKGRGVLVVPGALAVARDFDAFARELADRFTVHTIERRGRGESGSQGDEYNIERELEDVAAVQVATGATFLFGHSFGGLIALEAARDNKTFAKVAVYEPGVSIDGSIDTSWAPASEAQLARGQHLAAFITFARGVNPETTGKAPRWLLRLILPLAIRKRERNQKYGLLPAAIREHAEAARLDNTYPQGSSDRTGQHSAEAARQIEYLASQRNRDAAPHPGIQNALESRASANRG